MAALSCLAALAVAGCGGTAGKSEPVLFKRGSTEVAVRTKERLGGQWEVYFVPVAQPLAAAKACVRAYLTDAKAAFCYAFTSPEALDAAGIDPDRGGLKHMCWTSMWGHSISGDEDGSSQGPGDAGCP